MLNVNSVPDVNFYSEISKMLKALKKVILIDTVISDSVCTVERSFQVFKWHLENLGTKYWVLLSIDHIYALEIKKRMMKV